LESRAGNTGAGSAAENKMRQIHSSDAPGRGRT